jgi:hypothetical protein
MSEAPSEDLQRQYDRALDEYRFQVDLNWRRSEYFFVLNVGVLIAAATMFAADNVPRELVAVLFLIGALLAVLSVFANESQHGYYRSARYVKQRIEERLELKEMALATTPGMGSKVGRLGRVRTFLKIMLVAIAAVDLGGAAFAFDEAGGTTKADPPLSVLVNTEAPKKHRLWSALVVSQGGRLVQSHRLGPGSLPFLLDLQPGTYLVSLGGQSYCQKTIEVDRRPFQAAVLRC